MIIATLATKPAKSGARGPGDYFKRKLDSRKNPRDPKELFGNFKLFERCVSRSEAGHRYLSYVISYRGDDKLPPPEDRRLIHATVLRWFASGLAEQYIMAIAIDHGDHEHGALLRHAVLPSWPRFQAYYHPIDSRGLSSLQWLLNRRYGMRAPEDPRTHQLVSLAGKHFRNEDVEFIKRLRVWIEIERRAPNGLQSHEDFVRLLHSKGYTCKVVTHPDALMDENESGRLETNRVWMKLSSIHNNSEVLIKGPLCNPTFRGSEHEQALEAAKIKYSAFLADPGEVWMEFLQCVRMRHARIRKRHAALLDACCHAEFLGFEDLHPSRHLKAPVPVRIHDISHF